MSSVPGQRPRGWGQKQKFWPECLWGMQGSSRNRMGHGIGLLNLAAQVGEGRHDPDTVLLWMLEMLQMPFSSAVLVALNSQWSIGLLNLIFGGPTLYSTLHKMEQNSSKP